MDIPSPKVSVIIPTYNHAHYLPQAVNSVINQTYPDFEVIIVDDGSTDHTRQVVTQFMDGRVQYFYQTNKGLAAARNTGLRVAKGEYVVFLDADDLFLPNKLEAQIHWFSEHPDTDWVAGGWNIIDEEGKIISTYRPGFDHPGLSVRDWLYSCKVCPIAVMVSRKWVYRVGGFDESFRQVEDWDLWLRLAFAGCTMRWVEEVVASYRLSPGQMTRNIKVHKQSAVKLLEKFYNQSDIPDHYRQMQSEIMSHLLLNYAGREFSVGQWEEAQASLTKAIEIAPQLTQRWDTPDLDSLFQWEDHPYNRVTPIEFRRAIFEHLPAFAGGLRRKKRLVMGQAGLKTFYAAFAKKNWGQVRRASLEVAKNDPLHLLNRGFWKILMMSLKNS